MIYRTLGRTGLEVSRLGMGTGGLDPLGLKSGRTESEMVGLLHRAFDLGINLFDTSPGYGKGRSERILGRALVELPRDEVVVSTQIPLATSMPGEPAKVLNAAEVSGAVDESLERLHTDRVDVILMAVSGPEYFDCVMQDHVPVLEKLKQEGKTRFIGSSEMTRSDGSHEWLKQILPTGVVDVAMIGHNMINQSAQDVVFPCCAEHNIGVINVFTVRNLFGNPPRLREVIQDLKRRGKIAPEALPDETPLDWLLEDPEVGSLVAAAYRYALHTEPVTAVMSGTIERSELEENVATSGQPPLPENLRDRLKEIFGGIAEPIGN